MRKQTIHKYTCYEPDNVEISVVVTVNLCMSTSLVDVPNGLVIDFILLQEIGQSLFSCCIIITTSIFWKMGMNIPSLNTNNVTFYPIRIVQYLQEIRGGQMLFNHYLTRLALVENAYF